MLIKRPKLTKKSVQDAEFQKDYETYLGEQFPGRPYWVKAEAKLQRLFGRQDANGVYFGKDGYLLEKYKEQDFNWKKVKKNLKQTSEFLQEYPNAKVLFVPVKSSTLADKLPLFAQVSGEGRFFGMADKLIPQGQRSMAWKALDAHKDEYIYYRTDHHWTTLGAFYAYQAWAGEMGYAPLGKGSFTITPACGTFFGTTYAKARTGGRADTIHLYKARNRSFHLDYNMGEFQSASFYDMEKLDGDDPYSVFFGGNQALVDIRQEGEADGGTLLIIKDSFGNCFAPLAAVHYKRTVVVDLRYMNLPVSKLLKVYPADDILILYNSVQFMEDKDIYKLK